MALLLKLVYDTARVRSSYMRIHQEVFGFPARSLLKRLVQSKRDRLHRYQAELDDLCAELRAVREGINALPRPYVEIRRGEEIRRSLTNYTAALEDSAISLRGLCGDLVDADDSGGDTERLAELAAKRRSYDDALQHQHRLGARLNELLSKI